MAEQIPIVDYLVLDDTPHLRAHQCQKCQALYFDHRVACAHCENRTFTERSLGTTGTVRSFTIVHRTPAKVPTPYTSAVVELNGGGVVKANVINVDSTPEAVSLHMPVALATFVAGTDDEGTEAIAFGFEPRKGAAK